LKLKATVQVIFDLDGTLIDSAPDLHHAVNRMLADLGGAPLSLAQVRSMVGDGASLLIERSLAASGCSTADQGQALRSFLAFYAQDPVAHTQLFPGVAETLERLTEQGILLALCTNKPEALTRDILERLQLTRYFAQVAGGDTFPFRKPDPRMLLRLLEPAGTAPARALLVGDSEVDAATASAAGVPFILVSYGYHRSSLEEIGSRAVIDDLRMLPALLA
jgi:phosphoglycolate phosphatase